MVPRRTEVADPRNPYSKAIGVSLAVFVLCVLLESSLFGGRLECLEANFALDGLGCGIL